MSEGRFEDLKSGCVKLFKEMEDRATAWEKDMHCLQVRGIIYAMDRLNDAEREELSPFMRDLGVYGIVLNTLIKLQKSEAFRDITAMGLKAKTCCCDNC